MGVYHPVRRFIRPAYKSIRAAIRWKRFLFNDVPPVFGNAKPKSGSHLLLQILNASADHALPLCEAAHSHHHRDGHGVLLDIQPILKLPGSVLGWVISTDTGNRQYSLSSRAVNYFIYRDPRDLLVFPGIFCD
jgi:hypothetical protein